MKKIFKFTFLFLTLFLTINFVNAEDGELVCSPGDDSSKITIKDMGPKSTGWSSKIRTCEFNGDIQGYDPHDGFNSYSEALGAKLAITTKELKLEIWNAKDVVTKKVAVPVCDDENAKVDATTNCIAVWRTNKVEGKALCTKEDVASGNHGCTSTDQYYGTGRWYCPQGYKETTDGTNKCIKNEEYIYLEKGVSGDKTKDDAAAACRASKGTECTCNNPIKYILQCPKYYCTPKYETINTCVPSYELEDGSPVYCVNPSQGFNGDYVVDNNFDVNKCASSNSTIDCGYANILIESEYHRKNGEDVDDESINLALRLWGAHSGQNGYSKTGVANLKGCDCDQAIAFAPDDNGVYANIYKLTHDYIMEHFKDLAYKYDYIPPANTRLGETKYGDSLITITCNYENNRTMLGIICGGSNACGKTSGNTTIYRQAFDLFFNTLIGNKEMVNHLNDVVGGVNTEPDGVNVIVGEETGNGESKLWLDISYDEFSDLELEEVVYDCNELRKSTEVLDEDKQKIYPYCQTVYYLVDADGNRIKDSNGNVYDPIKVEECRKGSGCTTEEFTYAVSCRGTQTVTPINIRAYYFESEAKDTIQKYQSCANANVNQVMFGVVRDRIEGDSETSSRDPSIIYGDPVESRGASKDYSFYVSCGDPTCNETGTNKSDNFGSCAVKKDGELTYTSEGSYTNYIKDPSLKCIVNMTSNYKQIYDYSDHFGVNKNLCRVYCSDEVDYVLANKINAVAGETFDYNIELAMYKEKKSSHHLSSIVKEKRTCTSEIYYTKYFPEEIHNKIKSTYNLTDAESDKAKNIGSLLAVLMAKSQSSEGGREEVVNQILFDLYNCNIYKEEFDSKIKTPKNTANSRVGKDSHGNNVKFNKVYDFVDYLYGSVQNNYGLNKDCTLNNSTNTCINMGSVNYEFGAETETGKVNSVNLNPAMDSLRAEGIQNVQYCTNVPGKDCFEFVQSKDHQDYDYNNNSNWSNSSTNGKVVLFGKEYEIPTNDYAMFEVSVDIGFYNSERFQTKPGNGKVVELSKEEEDSKYITLDEYNYPISKNALTFDTNSQYCRTISSDTSSILKRCDISQVLSASESNNTKIYTFYRNQSNDQFFRDVNSSNNRFNCVIDVRIPKVTTCKDCSLDMSTVYRNADAANLFPNGVIESSNWATVEGQIAANTIESTSDMIRTSNDLLEYSISLTPEQIRALREYNSTHKDYVSEEIDNCDIKDGTYRNCKSTFLEILRGNTTELGTTIYGTLNPDYNGSKHFSGN